MSYIEAKIGSWYQARGGQAFEVVAVDGDDCIEIQYVEGEIEELDLETWEQMWLREVSAPDSWEGLLDETEEVGMFEDQGLTLAFEPEY